MSDINLLDGWGYFGAMWLISLYVWKTTALILAVIASFTYCWRSFRFRKQLLIIALALLVMHLMNSIYFNFIYR